MADMRRDAINKMRAQHAAALELIRANQRKKARAAIMEDYAKAMFLVCAVAWTLFTLWMWGPYIARGVQNMFGGG